MIKQNNYELEIKLNLTDTFTFIVYRLSHPVGHKDCRRQEELYSSSNPQFLALFIEGLR